MRVAGSPYLVLMSRIKHVSPKHRCISPCLGLFSRMTRFFYYSVSHVFVLFRFLSFSFFFNIVNCCSFLFPCPFLLLHFMFRFFHISMQFPCFLRYYHVSIFVSSVSIVRFMFFFSFFSLLFSHPLVLLPIPFFNFFKYCVARRIATASLALRMKPCR